jgi:hypothetical protein
MNALMKSSIFVLLLAFAPAAFADGVAIYNTIPSPLPPNIVSVGYEANGIGEFGSAIQFAGSNTTYTLFSATVAMSDWALASDYPSLTGDSFSIPLTLNLYSVGVDNSAGHLFASYTVDASIPWRPAPSPGCGSAYLASDGLCHNGSLSTVTFDLAGVTVPSEIVYGLAFNTADYGANPYGVPGPYVSLNFGLSTAPPTVGSNLDVGSPYAGAIEFDGPAQLADQSNLSDVPEPSPLLLFATGLFGIALLLMRRCLAPVRP